MNLAYKKQACRGCNLRSGSKDPILWSHSGNQSGSDFIVDVAVPYLVEMIHNTGLCIWHDLRLSTDKDTFTCYQNKDLDTCNRLNCRPNGLRQPYPSSVKPLPWAASWLCCLLLWITSIILGSPLKLRLPLHVDL